MRNHFELQLSQLNTELITMGALCEDAISAAAKGLLEGDASLTEAVLSAERQIDQKERDVETLCLKLLLQQQPVATDLRTVSSALKMISDMERIGDQAADIAEINRFVSTGSMASASHIADMARAAIRMVTDSVDSFVKKDADAAYEVIRRDDSVDALFSKVKEELICAVKEERGSAEELIDLLMIAKYFERIGDHAENIAEWVIFSITGQHKDRKDIEETP